MITNRRIYLNDEETRTLQDGKPINRIFKGTGRLGYIYNIKIIPKKKHD